MIKKGTWVIIQKTILAPDQRPDNIPEDTKQTPLVMWVKGFLQEDTALGQPATIKTKMNRTETGTLQEANPPTLVDYGEYVPEITQIGTQAREILFSDI
ncbi:MAG: 2-amino-4-oxopentanoate thiolase subunit OrtA [Defluviitaleaceae bacterium]|nr:2-amino-4-oxopentanoate thiolase subunit OrtA [Defluviitaleaceae bacterium]